MMFRRLALIAAAGALASGGCAKVGNLERPAPLVGAKAKAQYQAQQEAAAKAKAKDARSNKVEDLPDEVGEPPAASNPRNAPVAGAKPSPFGSPPPTNMPDPFNNPQ